MPKQGMIVARYCRAASFGIKRSVLETDPLAVALLPTAVLIILAMIL